MLREITIEAKERQQHMGEVVEERGRSMREETEERECYMRKD